MVKLQASTKFEVIPVDGEFIYDERARPLNFSRSTVVRMINIASGSARGILHVYLRQQGLNQVNLPFVQAERIMENFGMDSTEWGEITGDE